MRNAMHFISYRSGAIRLQAESHPEAISASVAVSGISGQLRGSVIARKARAGDQRRGGSVLVSPSRVPSAPRRMRIGRYIAWGTLRPRTREAGAQ
ncbi:hypothetical protein N9L68_04345 [bacterium]|nr:hypothetical protein [bacterium]